MKSGVVFKLVIVAIAAITLSSCKVSRGYGGGGYTGGGSSGGGGYDGGDSGGGGYDDGDSGGGDYGDDSWYDVYGGYCGSGSPSSGCNFYSDGGQVTDFDDPYSYDHNLEYGNWEFTDSYGYSDYYEGWAWLSPTGILYDDYGGALNEGKQSQGKDLVAKAAAEEKKVVAGVAKNFAEKYALSEATGMRVARTLNEWAVLAKTKSRTEADIAAFTTRLYGIDYNKVVQAVVESYGGDQAQLDGLIEEGASNWGTNPETMREILRTWYGKDAKENGINF